MGYSYDNAYSNMSQLNMFLGNTLLPTPTLTSPLIYTPALPYSQQLSFLPPAKLEVPKIKLPSLFSKSEDEGSTEIDPKNDKGKKKLNPKVANGINKFGEVAAALYDAVPTADKNINSNDEMVSGLRADINKLLLTSGNPYMVAAGAINTAIDKTGGFTDASKGLGGGLDTLNSIAALALPGAGWFTKKTMTYNVSDILKLNNAAYSGTLADNTKAALNSDAKIIFGKNKANNMLADASLYDTTVLNIMEKNEIAQAGAANPYTSVRNAYNMSGSWQNNTSFGKRGLKIPPLKAKEITLKVLRDKKNKQVDNSYNTFEEYYSKLPEDKRDTTNYNLKRAFELAPKEELDAFLSNPESHLRTVYFNSDGIGEFLKSKNHPTLWMELEYYNNGNEVITKKQDGKEYHYTIPADLEEWKNFRNSYDLDTTGYYYKYVPKKFKEGGKVNVIPDGALHARKHNMELEGITKKGIPVIAEDDKGEVHLLAEIEKEEIIFRLEVTKKLEELQKEYYKEDTTQKIKDKLSLEAGKLLVHEILYNTNDNVDLIKTV